MKASIKAQLKDPNAIVFRHTIKTPDGKTQRCWGDEYTATIKRLRKKWPPEDGYELSVNCEVLLGGSGNEEASV